MRRREFISLLGGAAAARPLAAWAQQREKMSRIGVLMNLTADDAACAALAPAALSRASRTRHRRIRRLEDYERAPGAD